MRGIKSFLVSNASMHFWINHTNFCYWLDLLINLLISRLKFVYFKIKYGSNTYSQTPSLANFTSFYMLKQRTKLK